MAFLIARTRFAVLTLAPMPRVIYGHPIKRRPRNFPMNATVQSDPISPGFSELGDSNPYPYYESLRARAPVVWDEDQHAWLVTGYEQCRQVEGDEATFRHPYADATQSLIDIKGGRRNVTILQGKEHSRMHRFLLKLFSPRLVEEYREKHIRPAIRLLLDRLIPSGRADLVELLTAQLPPRVLMSLFAMDCHDDSLVKRVLELHEVILEWIGRQNRGDDTTARARTAADEVNGLLLPYLGKRKAEPGDDLISRVWLEGPKALDDFSDADALATTREMFLAGTDTTVHALSNALYLLLTQPEVMERIRAERGQTLSIFVEESLRLYGAVQYRFRLANKDVELGGVPVKKDAVLILINSAANRDPAKYECPTAVNLDRKIARDHLAFNAGPRICIGAALARAEMVDAINALLDRTRNLRLDPNAEPPRFRFHYIRSFRPLNVLFEPVYFGQAAEEGKD
jgi:cytochrome P450